VALAREPRQKNLSERGDQAPTFGEVLKESNCIASVPSSFFTVFIDLFVCYLRSGRRGRRFKSCHSDQVILSSYCWGVLPLFPSAFKVNRGNPSILI
jgi:hypothetical protein